MAAAPVPSPRASARAATVEGLLEFDNEAISPDPLPQDAELTRHREVVWNDLLGSWMGRIAQIVLPAGLGG